jgi:hypothetical protein
MWWPDLAGNGVAYQAMPGRAQGRVKPCPTGQDLRRSRDTRDRG